MRTRSPPLRNPSSLPPTPAFPAAMTRTRRWTCSSSLRVPQMRSSSARSTPSPSPAPPVHRVRPSSHPRPQACPHSAPLLCRLPARRSRPLPGGSSGTNYRSPLQFCDSHSFPGLEYRIVSAYLESFGWHLHIDHARLHSHTFKASDLPALYCTRVVYWLSLACNGYISCQRFTKSSDLQKGNGIRMACPWPSSHNAALREITYSASP
jgi:hypothetical protein